VYAEIMVWNEGRWRRRERKRAGSTKEHTRKGHGRCTSKIKKSEAKILGGWGKEQLRILESGADIR